MSNKINGKYIVFVFWQIIIQNKLVLVGWNKVDQIENTPIQRMSTKYDKTNCSEGKLGRNCYLNKLYDISSKTNLFLLMKSFLTRPIIGLKSSLVAVVPWYLSFKWELCIVQCSIFSWVNFRGSWQCPVKYNYIVFMDIQIMNL